MSFALAGKHRVRPLVLFLGQGHGGGHDIRLNRPVRRRGLNVPDIPRLFERESPQPVFALGSQGNTIRYACWRTRSPREFVKQNGKSGLQWPVKAYAAALGVDEQSMTVFAERNSRIQTGKPKRDLRANPGTAPLCFKRFRTRAHMQTLFKIV